MWHGGLGRLIALLCLNGPPAAEHHARSAPKSAEVSSGDKTRRPRDPRVPLRARGKARHIFVTISTPSRSLRTTGTTALTRARQRRGAGRAGSVVKWAVGGSGGPRGLLKSITVLPINRRPPEGAPDRCHTSRACVLSAVEICTHKPSIVKSFSHN